MRPFLFVCVALTFSPTITWAKTAQHAFLVESPDRSPVAVGGPQAKRSWLMQGKDKHLAVAISRSHGAETTVTFNFPQITLGKDGVTFFFRNPEGNLMPVATQKVNPAGSREVSLLKTCFLLVGKSGDSYLIKLRIADRELSPTLD